MITGAYDVYRSDDAVALEYLTRLLLVLDENKALAPLYRGLRKTIPRAAFESLKVPMPTKEEQGLIVRYLDHAELRIAKAIAAKQRLIALLDEAFEHERDRLLFGTQSELKVATGIDWLEYAPEGWQKLRLKYVMRERVRKSKDGTETHLSMSQVHGLVPSETGGSRFLSLSYVGGKVCEEGEIVLNRLKAHLGVFALSPCLGVVSPDYAVLKVEDGHDARYFCALLRSRRLRPELRRRVTGLVEGFWRLYTDSLLDVAIMVPPLVEQQAIVEALNTASQKLEGATTSLRMEIALLKEYRIRLISDVVTGKIDVREDAAKLPEIDPMELATVAVGENGDNEEATDGE
jgi:type I restriction enzyme S subunit